MVKKGTILKPNCKDCEILKTVENCYKKSTGSYYTRCKLCDNLKSKKYRINNQEKIKQQRRSHYLENRDEILEDKRIYHQNNKKKRCSYNKIYREVNSEKIAIKRKAYYLENRDEILAKKVEYHLEFGELIRERRKDHETQDKSLTNARQRRYFKDQFLHNLNFRMKHNLRGRVSSALSGLSKSRPTLELIGCSVEHLWEHLENQFTSGMTRNNYGLYGWHVDHIRPCVSFDLTDPEQQKKCFHYSNLQPLWAEDNLKKGSHHATQKENI